ncbi:MAG: sigma-54 dependent transcriptional regulator [Pyrinomonadaceae bacterium]
MSKPKLHALVVDDEKNLRESLAELIEGEGFIVAQADDGQTAVEMLRSETAPDVLFLDIRMPRLDGLQVLQTIKDEKLTSAPVIVISAFGDSSKMIEAMRLGAYDYITKPLELDEIVAILHRAAEQRRLSLEAEAARRGNVPGSASAPEPSEMLGTSRVMQDIFKQIGRLAATDATVLVSGESGTGKELVARAIHQHSARAPRPFIAVNCGALPENLIEAELFGHERGAFTGADRLKKGRFELAHTGTLFLDEVGELTPGAQVKLLRALQERRFERVGGTETLAVDVRVIAASNRELRHEVEAKRFREDLYYRLRVIEINLPPLRARRNDIPQLAEHFLARASSRHDLPSKSLSVAALQSLMNYDFPGNVRELENLIERAAITSGSSVEVLTSAHLFGEAGTGRTDRPDLDQPFLELPFKESVAALEREQIRRALITAGGNRAQAARILGINRRLLYSKLEEHNLGKETADEKA